MSRRTLMRGRCWTLLAAIALTGCATISPRGERTGSGDGSALGQSIATGPTAMATSMTTTTAPARRRRAAPGPAAESIRLPPPPSASTPRSRAILRVATRFAQAYLLYQVGRESHPVREAILATSTPTFGRLLISQPVSVPAAQRQSQGTQPSELSAVTYTGPAALGPGPAVQIVTARYHTTGHPTSAGQLTIELTALGGQWHVCSLR